jgi:hypothetical protein
MPARDSQKGNYMASTDDTDEMGMAPMQFLTSSLPTWLFQLLPKLPITTGVPMPESGAERSAVHLCHLWNSNCNPQITRMDN